MSALTDKIQALGGGADSTVATDQPVIKFDRGILTIQVKVNPDAARVSGSGKSIIVADLMGTVVIDGCSCKVSGSCYTKL